MIGIKNFEMPKSCNECKIGHLEEESGVYTCVLLNSYYDPFDDKDWYNWKMNRDNNCPLVELPFEETINYDEIDGSEDK